ncbi:CPBP family intramembrane glutamic endopeptidase [Nocardia sp. NBC_00511]|uniref:CPBP family intramembrane glutamic endopeptidase n=1 Tax=Nocardia sp. NBC_00511 TaxID=2903591 RepID=UPI0030E243FC
MGETRADLSRVLLRPKPLAAMAFPPLWANIVLPALRLDVRGRTAANTAFATAYALTFDGTPHWTDPRGIRAGAAVAALVTAGLAAAVAIPATRRRLAEVADRGPDVHTAEWTVLHIPVGTVLAEELLYRATLTPLLERTAGHTGTLLGAITFGLAHIHPARSAGDSVPGTLAITTLAGALFDHLRRATGSTTAPALLHLALNAGGALAPYAARAVSNRRTEASR